MQLVYFLYMSLARLYSFFFFFNDTATTEIYTLSLHDALPIFAYRNGAPVRVSDVANVIDGVENSKQAAWANQNPAVILDRKSTRLNSSHSQISYAVFCLKKKKDLLPSVLSSHYYMLRVALTLS